VSIPEAWSVFNSEGRISDRKLEQRLSETGAKVARFARVHKCATAEQFLQEWQNAPDNPGGGARQAD
jgi:hypothetical protein